MALAWSFASFKTCSAIQHSWLMTICGVSLRHHFLGFVASGRTWSSSMPERRRRDHPKQAKLAVKCCKPQADARLARLARLSNSKSWARAPLLTTCARENCRVEAHAIRPWKHPRYQRSPSKTRSTATLWASIQVLCPDISFNKANVCCHCAAFAAFIKSEQNTLGRFLPSNFPSKERGLKKNCDKEWQRNTSCTSGVGSNCYDVDMLLSSYDCTELIKGNKSQESRTSTNNTSKHIQIHSKHIQIHPEFAAVWTSEAKASCVDPPHLGSHFATGMDCSCVGWPWQKLEENYEEHVHLLQVLNNRRISETIMGNWQQPNLPNALGLRTHQVTATVSGHQLEESRTVATRQPWEHVTSCFRDHGPHLLESLKYSKRS